MRQTESLAKIVPELKKDQAVRALFLKGSLARNEADEWSDVDLYCMVSNEGLSEFLPRRLSYLQQYKPLLYWSEVDFMGPQIVCVFRDGLHFDLYTVTQETLKETDQTDILYDPEGLLTEYTAESFAITDNQLCQLFDEFAFCLLEWEAAYNRQQILWAVRLASHLSSNIALILRHIYDPDNAQLGFKRLEPKLDKQVHKEFSYALEQIKPTSVLIGVKLLANIATDLYHDLPLIMRDQIHGDFFFHMMGRIYDTESN